MKRFFIMIFCCAGLLNLHGARVPYQTFELNAGKDGKPQIWGRGNTACHVSGNVKIVREKDGTPYFQFSKKVTSSDFRQREISGRNRERLLFCQRVRHRTGTACVESVFSMDGEG